MSGAWEGRQLHFIGVGGAGMSAYARAARALGAAVSGSDVADGPYLRALGAEGVLDAAIGHAAQNIPAGDAVEVVHSSAVGPDNLELVAARERGLAIHTRAQLLGELTRRKRTIAVGGTHGKTTTSSMVVWALRGAGLDPSWLIGGPAGGGLANGHWGDGEWLIVEADESDRSLVELEVEIAVLLNVELDHADVFATLDELRALFALFLERARRAIVLDEADLVQLRPDAERVAPVAVELFAGGSRFTVAGQSLELAVPGRHNAFDAAAAYAAALAAGAGPDQAARGLAQFPGAGRRFQLDGTRHGAAIYEDYAHHPTEVAATLAAARTLAPARLVAVFQPHMYSRTRLFADEFGVALADADVALVLDVYPARELAADHPGVSGLLVARAAADQRPGMPVLWAPTLQDAYALLDGELRAGDVCLVMGAGDVDTLAHRLAA